MAALRTSLDHCGAWKLTSARILDAIRLGTSATQFYRLLDQTNDRKSIDQMLMLLHVLNCDVDLIVRPKSA